MSRWLAWLPLAALVALAVMFAVFSLNRDPQIKPDALVGKPVPSVAVKPLEGGGDVDLAATARGRAAMINVFASWCAPCEVEHPELVRLKAEGVPILGVAYKDAPQATSAFLTRLGDPFSRVVSDLNGRAGIELGVSGVPETYVVDRRGVILAKHSGPLTRADADRLLAVWREAR